MDPKSPDRLRHVPLITLMFRKLKRKDKSLPIDPAEGMEIAGTIAPPHVLEHRIAPATTRCTSPQKGRKARNSGTIRAIPNVERWELSRIEYQTGWISEPEPIAESDMSNMAQSPRFFVAAQRGVQQTKYRVIGDLSRTHVNSTAKATGNNFPHGHGPLAAHVRTLSKMG